MQRVFPSVYLHVGTTYCTCVRVRKKRAVEAQVRQAVCAYMCIRLEKFGIWLSASQGCYLMPTGQDAAKESFLTPALAIRKEAQYITRC